MQPQDTGQTEPEGEVGAVGTPVVGPVGGPDTSDEERTAIQQMIQAVDANQRMDGAIPAVPCVLRG